MALAIGNSDISSELWASALTALEAKFSKPIFEMWIKPIRLVNLSGSEMVLSVQSNFARDWVENRLKAQISEVLTELSDELHDAVTGMRALHALLEPETAARTIFDLGLLRSLGYYTGAVFQVYDPAYGVPIGSGGRYDELLGQFGRPLPAVGFGLNVERVHIALTAEERGRSRGPA